MRVCFFRSEKPREGLLADAFARGVIEHGHECVVRRLTGEVQIAEDCEVAVMVGVKSRELFQANWRAGIHTLMIDKGYARHSGPGPVKLWEYWRVAVDSHHPTARLMDVNHPTDRFEKLGFDVKPWRESGRDIVIAGSSAKYHAFYGLSDPTSYARSLVKSIKRISTRPVVYRPKPSWREAVPVRGSIFSTGKEPLNEVLADAHVLVTHGSNACFEALLAGVPCIVLGDAVAKPISSTEIASVEKPYLASDRERLQLLANLAYFQWTMTEFATGEAWQHIWPQILK